MIKSASLSNALATLVESLLILAFFILIGILLAYLFYFIYQKIRRGTRHRHSNHMLDSSTFGDKTTLKREQSPIKFESKNEVESRVNSWNNNQDLQKDVNESGANARLYHGIRVFTTLEIK